MRSGDLDQYLLKPIDEQFLITTRHMDWSTFPNMLQGRRRDGLRPVGDGLGVRRRAGGAVPALFVCGCAMAYSFLLMLSSLSVWMVRNQSLMEMWWLFTTLMRYPREIFADTAGRAPVGGFFTFVVPVLLVVSVPASVMVGLLDDWRLVALMAVSAVLLLALSRWFFRYALRAYRSASS